VNIHKINNLFTEKELTEIKDIVNNTKFPKNDRILGRIMLYIDLPVDIKNKFIKLVNDISPNKLKLSHIMCVQYSSKYGQPNLPPHLDGSDTNIMIDFQLESNTSWDLGIDTEIYPLEDNSLLVFNPNENIHWRPYKTFKDGEYVNMIFARFVDPENLIDYSDKQYLQNDPIFQEINNIRDSLKN